MEHVHIYEYCTYSTVHLYIFRSNDIDDNHAMYTSISIYIYILTYGSVYLYTVLYGAGTQPYPKMDETSLVDTAYGVGGSMALVSSPSVRQSGPGWEAIEPLRLTVWPFGS